MRIERDAVARMERDAAARLERLKEAQREGGELVTLEAVAAAAPRSPVAGSDMYRRVYSAELLSALADDVVAWFWEDDGRYLVTDWLVLRGIPRSSIGSMCRSSAVFSAAWDYAMTVQLDRILRRGLECRADAQVTKLVLMAEHGFREQTELTAEIGAGRRTLPATIEEADRQIGELQAHRDALSAMVEQARTIPSVVVG